MFVLVFSIVCARKESGNFHIETSFGVEKIKMGKENDKYLFGDMAQR